MKMLEKFNDLAEKAEDIIEEFQNGDIDGVAVFKLVDLCYNILLINELENHAPKASKKKEDDEPEKKPAKAPKIVAPKLKVAPKEVVKEFEEVAPIVVPPAPKAPQNEIKPKGNQKFLDNKWDSYFDSPFITIYERHIPNKIDDSVRIFYSTLSINHEQMDVAFAGAWGSKFEEVKNTSATILPGDFLIQSQNGYAKLYIKSIKATTEDGKPIQIVEYKK